MRGVTVALISFPMASMNVFTSDMTRYLTHDAAAPRGRSWNVRQRDHDFADLDARDDGDVDLEEILVLVLIPQDGLKCAADRDAAVDQLNGQSAGQADPVAFDEAFNPVIDNRHWQTSLTGTAES